MKSEREITELDKGEVIFYKNNLEVRLRGETVWLTQAQISVLFGTKRPAITKHLANIFKSKELTQDSVCSILEHTAADGNTEIGWGAGFCVCFGEPLPTS